MPETKMKRLTIKQERFAREYIKNGGNGAQAYRDAYGALGWTDGSINTEAARTAALPHVSLRISEILDEALAASQLSPDSLVMGLLEIARDPSQNANARVKAYALLMKPLGMDVSRTIHEGRIVHDIDPVKATLSIEDLEALAADARKRLALEGEGGPQG